MWGLPNLFDFAQDSVVPTGHLAAIGAAGEAVTAYRYPPFHFWVLGVAYLPARALCSLDVVRSNPKVISTLFILTARLVSVAMAMGTVWLIYKIGRRLWDERTGLAAALVFALSPVTLYYAKNANLDIPYVFWLAWALLLCVRILQENRKLDYLWLGLVCALAVCTKDQAYAFVLLMPLPILLRLRAGRQNPPGTSKERHEWLRRSGLGVLGFIVPFVLIHNIIFDPAGFWQHVKIIIGPGVVGWREFSLGPLGQLRLLTETVLRLMSAWTPAGLALVIIGLVVGLHRGPGRPARAALLVPGASYYLLFLAIVGYAYPRFMLPILLVLCPFAGRAVVWLWTQNSCRPIIGRIVAVALLLWIGLAGLSLDYVMSNYSRYDAQMWMEKTIAPKAERGARVAYVGDMHTMPRFNEPINPQKMEEPDEKQLAAAGTDFLVLSFEPGHPAVGPKCVRLAAILRRGLGRWGLKGRRARTPGTRGFFERLVAGEMGYEEVKRFESATAAFVPQVAESVNRTIVIMRRKAR